MSANMRLDSVATTTKDGWCQPARQPARTACCVQVDGKPPDRPDLATYSQDEQFALGNAPTWDSPDILTNWWNPFTLMPETSVTVRNLSNTVSAVNGQITLFTSPFGLGMPRTALATQTVNLAPGQQVTLLYPLPQAIMTAADQRIGTYLQISHPYDAKTINNKGQQLIADAYTSAVGRAFNVTFPVMNPLTAPQQITMALLPNQLSAVVTPTPYLFAPLEQITATLSLSIPGGVHGTGAAPVRSDATVVARAADGSVLGGLTYVIWIDD